MSSQTTGTSTDSTQRGRGGFRPNELNTIPSEVNVLRTTTTTQGQRITCLTNCINVQPMPDCIIYQYRIDFEPDVESMSLRKKLFFKASVDLFTRNCIFDGIHDARSRVQLPEKETVVRVQDPTDTERTYNVTIKNVGVVTGSFEMVRVYNMHMKEFLRKMSFFQINLQGAYVHPELATDVSNTGIVALRGYRTSANIHENNATLMTLESVHKLMQKQNVLQYMTTVRNKDRANSVQAIKSRLEGKLVVTNYNKAVYKIEDVRFDLKPTNTFIQRKTNTERTYVDYYQKEHQTQISDLNQPLLLVVPNNNRRKDDGESKTDILLVPELCNIAGLTDEQRSDNRLKMELVRVSQIPPEARVKQLKQFLDKLNSTIEVKELLNRWGYSYGDEPLAVPARIIPTEKIGVGRQANGPSASWPTVDPKNGSFDSLIMRDQCAVIPECPNLKIIISQSEILKQGPILEKIRKGFEQVGLRIASNNVQVIKMENDLAQNYANEIKKLPKDTTMAIVILPGQIKDKYDAIKKAATTELGMLTQVITSRLMTDDRKASGAAVKIGVQVVAKLGGEPWWINLPLGGSMVCGYDTYHDTSKQGRSFGAFVASMNKRFSRWWSKADIHDKSDELSSNIAENVVTAMTQYYKKNDNKYPDRIFIYRDGVGDGQLQHVYSVELKQIIQAVKSISDITQLTFIIVNKRIGARFYWRNGQEILNPCPGTVIDDVVTRKERYDFYLISQSTRQGTVAPTYYNIIHDESKLDPEKHQAMAYKMCFAYYNWTGTVRVPAPCQYAHKLALLCGEHLHGVPNAALDDKLHFL